jgi:hypothetical protein
VDYRRASAAPGADRGSLPWRGASAAQPRRSLAPVRPGVGTDDAAPGADHARADRWYWHVIGSRVRAQDRPMVAQPARHRERPHALGAHVAERNVYQPTLARLHLSVLLCSPWMQTHRLGRVRCISMFIRKPFLRSLPVLCVRWWLKTRSGNRRPMITRYRRSRFAMSMTACASAHSANAQALASVF